MITAFSKVRTWYKRPNKSTFTQYVETFLIIIPIAFVIRTFIYGLYQVPTCSMEKTMLVGERFLADKLTIWFSAPKRGEIITFNDPNYDYSDNSFTLLFQSYVWGPSNWTKRVIGIPGDHVVGKIEDGKPVVYINGQKLDEPYVNPYPIIGVYLPNIMPPWTYRTYDPAKPFSDQPFYRIDANELALVKKLMARYGESWIKYPYIPAISPSGRIVDEYDIHLGHNQYWVMGDNRQGSYDSRFWGARGKPLDGSLIHGKILYRLWSLDSNESWWILDLIRHPIDFWKRVRWNRFFQRVA